MVASVLSFARKQKKRFINKAEHTVVELLKKYPPEKVREVLEKKALSRKKKDGENLAYYYLHCGDTKRALSLLEKNSLQDSIVYAQAIISGGGDLTSEIDRQVNKYGRISRPVARLIAKQVQDIQQKDKLKQAVLIAPSIEKEKTLWRLLVIGQASRCAGDYSDALLAYRTAFQRASHLYENVITGPIVKKKIVEVFDAEKAWQALNDFSMLAMPDWFIDAGTLLGFIREGSFLQHDYDLDLGLIDREAFFATKKKIFRSPIFELKPARVEEVLKVRHFNGVEIDIFLYKIAGDSMYKESHVYRWDFKPFTLEKRVFGEVSLPIPSEPEKHLEFTYGDWWIPRKGFDGRYDALNVSFPNIDELECVLRNKAILALQKGNQSAYQKELHMLQRIGRNPFP